jgi:hypothetical protein
MISFGTNTLLKILNKRSHRIELSSTPENRKYRERAFTKGAGEGKTG